VSPLKNDQRKLIICKIGETEDARQAKTQRIVGDIYGQKRAPLDYVRFSRCASLKLANHQGNPLLGGKVDHEMFLTSGRHL
jgi:hypothetical protein